MNIDPNAILCLSASKASAAIKNTTATVEEWDNLISLERGGKRRASVLRAADRARESAQFVAGVQQLRDSCTDLTLRDGEPLDQKTWKALFDMWLEAAVARACVKPINISISTSDLAMRAGVEFKMNPLAKMMAGHWRYMGVLLRSHHALQQRRSDMEEEENNNGATQALDDIAKLSGIDSWEYPGQVVRDCLYLVRDVLQAGDGGEALLRQRLRAAGMSEKMALVVFPAKGGAE